MRQGFRIWRLVACTVVLAALYASSAFARNTTGALVGQVTDQSIAVVPNVKVEMKSSGTGQARVRSTNYAGEYTATPLQTGYDEVTAPAAGIKIGVQSYITIEVQQTVRAYVPRLWQVNAARGGVCAGR